VGDPQLMRTQNGLTISCRNVLYNSDLLKLR
jgi:hypothetical protein